MPSGGNRSKCRYDPRACLRLCYDCHQGKQGAHSHRHWPLARQAALKKIRDPEHYDLDLLNGLRTGRGAVSPEEVQRWVEKMDAAEAAVEQEITEVVEEE